MLGFSVIGSEPLSAQSQAEAGGSAAGVTFIGTAAFIPGLATGGSTAAGVIFTGLSAFLPGSATGGGSGIALGVTWTGASSWLPGLAAALTYTRAPSGGGYSPRRDEASSRPAAIQRNQER